MLYNLIRLQTAAGGPQQSAVSCTRTCRGPHVDRQRGGPRGWGNPNNKNLWCLGVCVYECVCVFKPMGGRKKGLVLWKRKLVKTVLTLLKDNGSKEYISSLIISAKILITAQLFHMSFNMAVWKKKVSESGVSIFQRVNLWQLWARLRPELLHVSVCLQGKQIKDASHFRGCKSAPGDGSGVSDTPNPPQAASTYRLPIHVSSKWTLQTSSVIKCSME